MNVLAVNGSPRRKRNTASLLEKMLEGAAGAGAETELVHLYGLKYTGCISCFQCKLAGGKSYGRCAVRDGLTPLLEAAHAADVLVLGTPVYFNAETGMMRSFMERLWFQYHRYTHAKPPLSPRKKACALVYTMNIREEDTAAYGTDRCFTTARTIMERFFGPCELFLGTDTKQMDDYSKYEMDYFDPAEKDRRHEEVFPLELRRASALGASLVS